MLIGCCDDDVRLDYWWLRSAYDSYCENVAYVDFFGYISLFDTYYSARMFSHTYGVLLACVI